MRESYNLTRIAIISQVVHAARTFAPRTVLETNQLILLNLPAMRVLCSATGLFNLNMHLCSSHLAVELCHKRSIGTTFPDFTYLKLSRLNNINGLA